MNFQESLNIKVGEIERPPLPPAGHYKFQVTKFVFDERGDYDIVSFQTKATDYTDDVDFEALQSVGGLKSVNLRRDFMFPKGNSEEDDAAKKRTMFNLRRFLSEHLQIEGADDMPLKQAINESFGKGFPAHLQCRPDKNDPEVKYAEIGRTAPIKT